MKKIIAADLFCGAGGTSTGLAQACRAAGVDVELLAINHWQIAIDTHAAAHPWAKHKCASLDHLRPQEVIPGGRLHLLVASPECTHHARARGGRPVNDQSRATAWHICKWAQELYIDNILIENVREFREWGPLGANGKPLKSRKGETYMAFLNTLRSLGYTVEDRVLNAADFGDPTTRERLFIQARRRGKITWPEPTHSARPAEMFFGKTKRWRAAKEIIDWSIPNQSIFERKKPLAPTTMRRILAGMEKFNAHLQPFIVTLRNHVAPRSAEEPIPTITGGGNHVGLCEPFVLQQQSGGAPRKTDDPLPTVATKGAIALVEPFLLNIDHQGGNGSCVRSTEEPLSTVTSKQRAALVEAFLVQAGGPTGKARQPRSIEDPLATVVTENHTALVEPFLVEVAHGTKEGDTETRRARSIENLVPTVLSSNRLGLVEPFITKFYRTGVSKSVDEPLDTVTTRDRFGLVQPEWNGYRLDIRFRMLQPSELAAAQGFPSDYPFTGNKSQVVKQIGNAVPVNLARALCSALLADYAAPSRKGLEARA
jgi:DNA (cytosine-5)-methyltransferase 1